MSRKYSGAYRDKKDRIRPITPRKTSSSKTGVPVRKRNSLKKAKGPSSEYDEFKKYIAISPSLRELQMTEQEIVNHPRLTETEKADLYLYIRARAGNVKESGYPGGEKVGWWVLYGPHSEGSGVRKNNYPDSVYYNFDLTHVKSESAWRAFLNKHKFRSVGAPDPDVREGGTPRRIYLNPEGVILVTNAERQMMMATPAPERREGWKMVETGEWDLGYVRFEGQKSNRGAITKVLKDFRGPKVLRGQDIYEEDAGGIVAYVKEEASNTETNVFI
jgi:hypothetical protein